MPFAGRGIYYNATHMEAQLCDSEEVAVVGGGNSAGQAAVFLAQTSSKVHLLVRSKQLSESMSQYLIARIDSAPEDRNPLSNADCRYDRSGTSGKHRLGGRLIGT